MSRPEFLPELMYRVYDARLYQQVRQEQLPQHIAVILDGNRRFAKQNGLPSAAEGHRVGAEKIPELLDWCDDLGIGYVTLWLLSTDNLGRDADELEALVQIISDTVKQLANQRERWPGLRITGMGALGTLPAELAQVMRDVESATADGTGMRVQIAVGYGGRREVVDALRSYLAKRAEAGDSIEDVIANLESDDITAHLYTAGIPDPDLIIRTSGEIRLSGFMMWQSAHSEFYFCDPFWPEFRHTDFLRALREFQSRKRRFGK